MADDERTDIAIVCMSEDSREAENLASTLRRNGFRCVLSLISDRSGHSALVRAVSDQPARARIILLSHALFEWLGHTWNALGEVADATVVMVRLDDPGPALPDPSGVRVHTLSEWDDGEFESFEELAVDLRARTGPLHAVDPDLDGIELVRIDGDDETVLGIAVDPGWVATLAAADIGSGERGPTIHWGSFTASTSPGGRDGSGLLLKILGRPHPRTTGLAPHRVDERCSVITVGGREQRVVPGVVLNDIARHTVEVEVAPEEADRVTRGSPVVQQGRVVGLVDWFRRDPGRLRMVPSRVFEDLRQRTMSGQDDRFLAEVIERARSRSGTVTPEGLLLAALTWSESTGGEDSAQAILQALGVNTEERLQAAREAAIVRHRPSSIEPGDSWVWDRLDQLVRQVSYGASPGMRHVVAVALSSGPLDHGVLQELGVGQDDLRSWLLAYLQRTHPRERRWNDVLERDTWAGWSDRTARSELARGFDPDIPPTTEIEDHLDLGVYLRMLASVLGDFHTRLPLSVGVFGEWGAGKSHFMGLLEAELEELARAERARPQVDGVEPAFCRNYSHITFNAWHFSDGNLWASLTEHVLRKLDVQPDVKTQILIEAEKLRQRRDAVGEHRSELSERETELKVKIEAVETELEDAQSATATVRETVRAFADETLEQMLETDEVTVAREELERAASDVGIDISDLDRATIEVRARSARARVAALVAFATRNRWAWIAALVLVVVVPVVVGFVAKSIVPALGAVGVSALVVAGSLVEVARRAARSVLVGLRRVSEVEQRVALNRLASRSGEHAKLQVLRDEEADLRDRQLALESELVEIDQKLDQLEPHQRFRSYVAERLAEGVYDRELGVISFVRADFEALSGHLKELRGLSPDSLDRIVLYIDDLDRCRPERVVEVLEAVHLLLAFDLFVVVVGVDPGWLARSLEVERAALAAPLVPGAIDGERGWSGTALTYLEKIFQIPFVLPPMGQTGLESLIEGLREAPAAPPAPAPQLADEAPEGDVPEDEKPEGQVAEPAPPTSSAAADGPENATAPQAIPLTPEERAFLGGLAPLVATPRAAKRLANLYRMVRASPDLVEPEPFLDGDEYQVLAEMLAVVSAYPELFGTMCGSRDRPTTDGSEPLMACTSSMTWASFVDGLAPIPIQEEGPAEALFANRVCARITPYEVQRWRGLHEGLTSEPLRGNRTPVAIERYQHWASVAAHFSFDLSTMR